jgi:hypothetical protein
MRGSYDRQKNKMKQLRRSQKLAAARRQYGLPDLGDSRELLVGGDRRGSSHMSQLKIWRSPRPRNNAVNRA